MDSGLSPSDMRQKHPPARVHTHSSPQQHSNASNTEKQTKCTHTHVHIHAHTNMHKKQNKNKHTHTHTHTHTLHTCGMSADDSHQKPQTQTHDTCICTAKSINKHTPRTHVYTHKSETPYTQAEHAGTPVGCGNTFQNINHAKLHRAEEVTSSS